MCLKRKCGLLLELLSHDHDKQTHSVFHTAKYPSAIDVDVAADMQSAGKDGVL